MNDYSNKHETKHTNQMSYCGNYVVDIILRMYSGLYEKQNIEFYSEINIPNKILVKDSDICVVLSNILENALEASLKISEKDRKVFIRIVHHVGKLGILVENSFDGTVLFNKGNLFSSKEKYRQGIGILSVESTVAKYGGSTDFYADKNKKFYSEILIPII